MNGNTPFIARVVADLTALAAGNHGNAVPDNGDVICCRRFFVFTELADLTHQTLCHDTYHRVGDQIRCHAHIRQTDNGRNGIVGMQGGNYQVSGDCRTHGNFSRFCVTGFTDHDNIRILTHQRTESHIERQTCHRIYLRLVNVRNILLHRILDRGNIHIPS